ncbi:LolA family protein [Salinicoccus bachuensis]|uniref:Outer membrane lipoprotein carrier protein LolA n=1 Tax=Salinicoccus bachuensis TaxID=3136731 RepID=A0ABZ3CM35_9STAP
MNMRWLMLIVAALYLSGCGMKETEETGSRSEESTAEVPDEPSEASEESEETFTSPESMTAESIVEAVEARSEENVNYFLHTRVSMEYEDETQVSETKEWYHKEGEKDFVRREVYNEGMPVQYYVNDGEKAWQYSEGDSVAYVSDVTRGGDMMARPSGVIGNRLRNYQEGHTMALEETVEIAGHAGYHIAFTPKENPGQTALDVYLNVNNGLILKEVMIQDGHQMVYELIAFEGDVEHSPERYAINLPEDVEVIDMSQPEHDTDLDSF